MKLCIQNLFRRKTVPGDNDKGKKLPEDTRKALFATLARSHSTPHCITTLSICLDCHLHFHSVFGDK